MQWDTIPKRPQLGEKRTIFVFAWWPTQLRDGKTVWLESYAVDQQWALTRGGAGWCFIGNRSVVQELR